MKSLWKWSQILFRFTRNRIHAIIKVFCRMQAVGHFFRFTGKVSWEAKTLQEGNNDNRMVVGSFLR